MAQTANEKILDKQMWLNSLKTTAKILLACVVCFFYVISILFFLAPKFDAKIFGFVGLDKAQESCYLQEFKNTNDTADLYNLILLDQELGFYENELKYINQLLDREDYGEFCKKLNESTIKVVSKELYPYSANTKGYVLNRKLKCMYQINKNDVNAGLKHQIMTFVRAQLNQEETYESTFATYVSLVLNDETLTREQQIELFDIFDTVISTELTISTSELLEKKEAFYISNIIKQVEIQDEVREVILRKYLVDFYKAWFNYGTLIGENQETLNALELKHSSAVASYNNLFK